MSMTGTIIAMGSTAVVTAITEKVLSSMGKCDMAQMVNIGGFALEGCQAVILIKKLIDACATLG